jgi:hypothetical protein
MIKLKAKARAALESITSPSPLPSLPEAPRPAWAREEERVLDKRITVVTTPSSVSDLAENASANEPHAVYLQPCSDDWYPRPGSQTPSAQESPPYLPSGYGWHGPDLPMLVNSSEPAANWPMNTSALQQRPNNADSIWSTYALPHTQDIMHRMTDAIGGPTRPDAVLPREHFRFGLPALHPAHSSASAHPSEGNTPSPYSELAHALGQSRPA